MENPYQTPQTNQVPAAQQNPLTVKQMLFSLQGRIPRSKWWLYIVLLGIVANVVIGALVGIGMASVNAGGSFPIVLGIILFAIYVLFIWISICINAKRCHDSNNSGWMSIIPIYGLILCGFIAGTTGPNRFGANPLGRSNY